MTKMMKPFPAALAGSVAGCLALALAGAAHAQTASQLTQPSYAPPVVRPAEGGVSLSGSTGADAPAGAEKLSVTPSGLIVDGGWPEFAGETAAIEATLKGQKVTGADLFAAARRLEEAYTRAGYVLVRVSLPPQTIRNGKPLRLVVTDGQIEAVDVSALPARVQGHVRTVIAPLAGKPRVTQAELERRLLLAGDTPGLILRSTLKAGTQPGTTVIVVDGRHDAISATVTMDNSTGKDLGGYTAGLGVDFNSLLGFGETAYLRANGYPGLDGGAFSDDPRNRQLIAGVTVPLGGTGAWANVEAVDSRTHPKSELPFTMLDRYQRFSARLGYSWIRSRSLNTSSVLAFDAGEETLKLDLGTARTDFAQDRLRVLRLTQTADAFLPWEGRLNGSITASFGLDGLGARQGTSALPMTRLGAKPDFRKLDVTAGYTQPLFSNRVYLSLAAKAQTSFGEALVSSEQFGLGGADWVSAYRGGQFQGDSGAAFRSEVSLPVALPSFAMLPDLGSAVMPYLFAAGGFVKLEKPSAVEKEYLSAGAFGAGLRVALSQKATPHSGSLSLEYARGGARQQKPEDRINFRLALKY
ncbi:ShlB/FhaC/HecB family hemolysin secretion/activation protein [Pannonibacter phragmitetus]|nr:ShlB/FhaC/HecB family hemolysin secretion/activation protein [Pannonibacter phragmitetus]